MLYRRCRLVTPIGVARPVRCTVPTRLKRRCVGYLSRAIKPGDVDDPDVIEAEVVKEDELPNAIPDPLMDADVWDDDEDISKLDPVKRSTKIIVDLVNAGSAFEDKLQLYREYLDVDLLEKFYKRIEFSEQYEDPSAAEGLKLIWRRVRAEVERKNATPAQRLLDELLTLLHPSAGGSYQDRYRSALALMHEAFTHSQSDTVDIFGLAEALAEGDNPPESLLQEFVQKSDFIKELQDILATADDLEQDLLNKQATLTAQLESTSSDSKALSQQLSSLEVFMRDRKKSLKDVGMLLEMAEAI